MSARRRRRPSNRTTMSAGATVEGLGATLKAFNRLDKEAKDKVREAVLDISSLMAREIAAAGAARPDRRDRHVAETIRGTKDRLPKVSIGKASRMDVKRRGPGPRASDLMFGMEFGSDGGGADTKTRRGGAPGWRFPERTPQRGAGNEGYWIFPTARAQQRRVVDLWAKALEDVAREWTRG